MLQVQTRQVGVKEAHRNFVVTLSLTLRRRNVAVQESFETVWKLSERRGKSVQEERTARKLVVT